MKSKVRPIMDRIGDLVSAIDGIQNDVFRHVDLRMMIGAKMSVFRSKMEDAKKTLEDAEALIHEQSK